MMMRCRGQLTKGGIGAFISYSLYERGVWLMGGMCWCKCLVRFFCVGILTSERERGRVIFFVVRCVTITTNLQ